MKRLVLEEGLKIRHVAVLRPKLSYNLFSNRLFELFFGIMGTEFYYFDERFDQDPDFSMLQTDPELYEAYRDPGNPRCMHSLYNYITAEMEEGEFIDFCQVLKVKPVIVD